MFIEDYINKIILLEKQIGAKTKYNILEPFLINPGDSLSLQEAAKKIARFIGLHDIIFIVTPTNQNDKVGGQIELKQGEKVVFIEISNDILEHKEGVLATLAHEITHKYMQINSITCERGLIHKYENEIFTDITSIFLGLGKLMLNGCQTERIKSEREGECICYTTRTLKIGYLNIGQLAFVYRCICAMRKVPDCDMISSLSEEAKSAIYACHSYQCNYFNPKFHDESYRNELIEILKKDVQCLESELEQIKQHLDLIKKKYILRTEEFLRVKNKDIISITDALKTIRETDIYDPCLLFLSTIELLKKTDKMRKMLEQGVLDAKKAGLELNKLTELNQEFLPIKPQKRSLFAKIFPRDIGGN
jgi:predicted RNA-binding protein with PUA-like domain